MDLEFLPQSGQWNPEHESVRFGAREADGARGGKPVTCLIHKVALADICHLHDASLDDLLSGFEKQRRKVEAIARWKYEGGARRPDGAIFITAQDVDAFSRRNRIEREVTLIFDSSKVHYDTLHEWVRFYAADGDLTVACAVTRGALLDRERVAQATDRQLIDAYLRNRQIIEAVAETKYRNNEVEPGGIVVVMSRDLNH